MRKTVADFLKTALVPVGRTLYIYGGGWNREDTGAGRETRTLGASPEWTTFFDRQDAFYSYKGEDAARGGRSYYPHDGVNVYCHEGLDCSGYLGWAVYNTLETENGKPGYVTKASGFAAMLAERGYGTLRKDAGPGTGYRVKPGDIVSISGHVWISLGTCADGSAVILHSTPSESRAGQPGGGVQIGAVGDSEACEAYRVADLYMSRFCPEWYRRYPVALKPEEVYFSFPGDETGCFTFDGHVLADPDGIRGMKPAELLKVQPPAD